MTKRWMPAIVGGVCLTVAGAWLVVAQEKKHAGESERKVQEADVPAAALAALKKLAGAHAITEFAEETDRGQKFYEGSWKTDAGNVDALVTPDGDLVELEETIAADAVPAAVRAALDKAAGEDARVTYEKKTQILYEAHFTKGERERELLLSPSGAQHREDHKNADGERDEDDD